MGFVEGKVILVTGASSGIGRALARQLLALQPKHAFLVSRRGAVFQQSNVTHIRADLSSPEEARAVAERVKAHGMGLHLLVSNAGVFDCSTSDRMLTAGGHEVHFATNFLSMVVLCAELRDTLIASKPSRIVVTGSFTAIDRFNHPWGRIDLSNMQGERLTTSLNPFMLKQNVTYAHSKLLQFAWIRKFAERLPVGVTANVFEPGFVDTNLDAYRDIRRRFGCVFNLIQLVYPLRTPMEAACPAVWACDEADLQDTTGSYIDWGVYGLPERRDPVAIGFFPTYNRFAPSLLNAACVDAVRAYVEQLLSVETGT